MKLFERSKKGSVFEQLSGLGVGITTFLVLIAVMFVIMAQVRSQVHTTAGDTAVGCNSTNITRCGYAENATLQLMEAGATIPGWVGIIVIVSIGALILGMLGMFGRRPE